MSFKDEAPSGADRQQTPKVSLRRFDMTGEGVSTPPVYCEKQKLYVSLSECRACDECDGPVHPAPEAPLHCSSARLAAAQERSTGDGVGPEATVSAIMTRWVLPVTPQTLVSELAAIFVGRGISAAPVIDSDGHAIGLVSKSDIVRYFYESGGQAGRDTVGAGAEVPLDMKQGFHVDVRGDSTVADVMTPVVFGVDGGAPVNRAAALMAFEHVHHLVVTDEHQEAIGMLSSLDVMAWVGRQDGYVIPSVHPPAPDA
jgi:CBS-domain-containing membrane protein